MHFRYTVDSHYTCKFFLGGGGEIRNGTSWQNLVELYPCCLHGTYGVYECFHTLRSRFKLLCYIDDFVTSVSIFELPSVHTVEKKTSPT